jgi:outer membrane protein assembly factor BamA
VNTSTAAERRAGAIAGSCIKALWITILVTFSMAISAEIADPQTADGSAAQADPDGGRAATAPDLRETRLPTRRGDFVAVPIPTSDPTLGTGLVAAAAYFYPQTEAQKESQPASVTALAGMYTSNKSYAYGIGQQNYWGGDKWRFTGALGRADLKLEVLAPTAEGDESRLSWLIDGTFVYADLARAVRGNWFVGLATRYVDIHQSFSPPTTGAGFDLKNEIRSVGIGLNLKFDNRDLPINSYAGRYLELVTMFNDENLGSDASYETLTAAYRSYHSLTDKLVLAWELEGCTKGGKVPLWDACRLGLRGFPATDYMAKSAASAQLEARWHFRPRWGVVAFAGAGGVDKALASSGDSELVPSVGLGLRFMVLPAKRINLRLDYGRSDGSEAFYVSVGEAF